jgi:hypothetical protein
VYVADGALDLAAREADIGQQAIVDLAQRPQVLAAPVGRRDAGDDTTQAARDFVEMREHVWKGGQHDGLHGGAPGKACATAVEADGGRLELCAGRPGVARRLAQGGREDFHDALTFR